MNKSHRHHYLPQFLLKNFTFDGKHLFIYDKLSNRVYKRHIRNSFFEWDRNTTKVNDIENSLMEDMYSRYDSEFSILIRDLINGELVTDILLAHLIFFASLHKWRSPASDIDFSIVKEETSMRDLKFYLERKDGTRENDDEINNLFMNIPLIKEMKRVFIPMLKIMDTKKLSKLVLGAFVQKVIQLPDTNPCPNLVGDTLVLERFSTSYNELRDFVMPLSSNFSLVCKLECEKNINNVSKFKIGQDLATIHRSKRYFACADYDYLMEILSHYRLLEDGVGASGKLDEYIMQTLFDSFS